MAKVIVTSDSTADLDQYFIEREIPTLPLHVLLGERDGEDGVDVFPADIFKYFEETKTTPKTAAITQDVYYEFFKKYTDQGLEVVHLVISSDISMCYENAARAAKECGGVYVVDTRNLSTGMGLLALNAQDLANAGMSGAQIYDYCIETIPKVQASFVVDTMTFLHKGGRCSGLAAFLAGVIKIKPSIEVINGKMGVGTKYIGNTDKAIQKYVADLLKKHPKIDNKYIFITHSYASDETVESARKLVSSAYPDANILITHAGATITSHCGKGTLGVLFISDKAISGVV